MIVRRGQTPGKAVQGSRDCADLWSSNPVLRGGASVLACIHPRLVRKPCPDPARLTLDSPRLGEPDRGAIDPPSAEAACQGLSYRQVRPGV
jgi:hypothetical protein